MLVHLYAGLVKGIDPEQISADRAGQLEKEDYCSKTPFGCVGNRYLNHRDPSIVMSLNSTLLRSLVHAREKNAIQIVEVVMEIGCTCEFYIRARLQSHDCFKEARRSLLNKLAQ